MRLPNCSSAVLDIRKLEDYCLDPLHRRGRHKARVFRSALGIDRTDALWLREALLEAIQVSDATQIVTDKFGVQWRVDVMIMRQSQHVVVRTIWIIRADEDVPRFVTCWVL